MRGVVSHRRLTVGALLALTVGVVDPGVGSARPDPIPCDRLARFDSDDFEGVRIDNEFLPLVPGTQRVFEGDVGGVAHRVTFTVTDLVKKINGVETLVIWDVDESDGIVSEAELAFFAQDEDGNVWNLGEYPEEYDDGVFVGAPNTWIAGEEGAKAGIHMAAEPVVSSSFYLQGFAPAIDFLDCGRVVETGASVEVPAGTFEDVLVTNETDPNVPTDGIQIKNHAPGVGIVSIGVELPGANPETLEMVSIEQLNRSEMAMARRAALRLDRRGCRNSEVYCATRRAERIEIED